MAGKYEIAGEIEIRGKAAKIVLGSRNDNPVRFFCFVSDLANMLKDPSRFVNIYHDNVGSAFHADEVVQ